MQLNGSTVIPGLVGMHDHLFYTAAGGRAVQMGFTGPRLYLASGVTTIRTTGGRAPYAEINTKAAIDAGRVPGPRVHLTAPYITGGTGGTAGSMAEITSPEAARRFVAYWAQEGVEWIKAYTDIRSADLKAAIDEAHKRGIKVTGHLCSVSFREAVDLGIDNLEHGLFTNTDFDPQKKPDVCPPNSMVRVSVASMTSDTAKSVIQKMIAKGVGMTSTLAVYETFFQNRPVKDERTLEAMSPEVRAAYLNFRGTLDTASAPPLTAAMLKNAMVFDKAFVAAGGRLAAGVDPTGFGGALAGFGDQRNYELLVEAGFTPTQTIQIMSANGAKILGVYDKLGSIERGKLADACLGDPRHEWRLERAGGDHHLPRLVGAVIELHDITVVLPPHRAHAAVQLDRKIELARIVGEVIRHLVPRRITIRIAGKLHPRQGVVARGCEELQRVPTVAPGSRRLSGERRC